MMNLIVLLILGFAGWFYYQETRPVEVAADAAMVLQIVAAEDEPGPGLTRAVVRDGSERGGEQRIIYLHPTPIVVDGDFRWVGITNDAEGTPALGLGLDVDAARRMQIVTRKHIGKPFAIVIDGTVIQAPIVRAEVSRQLTISGNFSEAEVRDLVERLSR